jgi:putative SOS response-associated peptidase YedK
VWFALNDHRPLFAFAGIWTEFRGDSGTKSKPILGPHLVYGFLTTAPNATVEPIHPKAMPVILTTDEEHEVWMRAHGMRPRHCSGHCRMTRYGLSRAALIKKTAWRREKVVR